MGPEVLFHHGVRAFGLAIGLRVKGGAQPAVDPQPAAESLPEGRRELGASVRNNTCREAVKSEDMFDE